MQKKLVDHFELENCFRVGGDEFYVLAETDDIDKIIYSFELDRRYISTEEEDFNVVASYGFVRLKDFEFNYDKAIEIADRKMHEMKCNSDLRRENYAN